VQPHDKVAGAAWASLDQFPQEDAMSTSTQNEQLTDTREMLVVHSLFRRELRLASGLVRGVAPGDARRAGVVSAHLGLVEDVLHHHHTSEDDLLWPKLLDRVPEEIAPVVRLMEAQHGQVDVLLARIGVLRPQWTQDPTTERGAELAGLYDELYGGLAEHLGDEETRVLPLVARCITAEEWNELGEAGRTGIPRKDMALVFGMMMYEGDPEVVKIMLAPAPLPVRVLVPRLGRRAFRKHSIAVHGTATP
jgi:iron-sulfur cluster repair protein YtfE (RIC family)